VGFEGAESGLPRGYFYLRNPGGQLDPKWQAI
jgi:hypothetical protein